MSPCSTPCECISARTRSTRRAIARRPCRPGGPGGRGGRGAMRAGPARRVPFRQRRDEEPVGVAAPLDRDRQVGRAALAEAAARFIEAGEGGFDVGRDRDRREQQRLVPRGPRTRNIRGRSSETSSSASVKRSIRRRSPVPSWRCRIETESGRYRGRGRRARRCRRGGDRGPASGRGGGIVGGRRGDARPRVSS